VERPRINEVTLSFLLLLMLLVTRAVGSNSTEFKMSALFRSGFMHGPERVNRQPTSVSTLK